MCILSWNCLLIRSWSTLLSLAINKNLVKIPQVLQFLLDINEHASSLLIIDSTRKDLLSFLLRNRSLVGNLVSLRTALRVLRVLRWARGHSIVGCSIASDLASTWLELVDRLIDELLMTKRCLLIGKVHRLSLCILLAMESISMLRVLWCCSLIARLKIIFILIRLNNDIISALATWRLIVVLLVDLLLIHAHLLIENVLYSESNTRVFRMKGDLLCCLDLERSAHSPQAHRCDLRSEADSHGLVEAEGPNSCLRD